MHMDRDDVFLLAHSEEMPRSALIGRAVPLLDPWDRSKSIQHSNYVSTHAVRMS